MGLPEAPWPPILEGEEDDDPEHGGSVPEAPTALPPALCSSGEVLSTIYKVTEVVQETFAAGVCGLRNLGNTCFMNAGLQCLLSNTQLLAFLLSFPTEWSSEQTSQCPPVVSHESLLVSQLARLAQQVWSGRFGTLRPATFKDALANACPQFSDYRQHDCQEFLTLLLDALHEQTNEVNLRNGLLAPPALRSILRHQETRLPSRSLESKYSEARESMVSGEETPEALRQPAAEAEVVFPVHNDLLAAALKEALEENVEPEAKRLKSDAESDCGLSAEESWEKYRASNRSVVVDTFQGQLQSKVVCAECGHTSVTYEPFMYLPLPLPHAMEMHISVTYVPLAGPRLRCMVKVGRVGRVGQLCRSLEALLGAKGQHPYGIALAHVSPEDNVIERFLEDHLPVRYLEDGGRLVYAFALGPATANLSAPACEGSRGRRSWQTCAICLEEKADDELRTHPPCGGLLCYTCVQVSCEHYGRGSLLCPVCNASLMTGQEFVPLSPDDPRTKDRPVMVSVLLHGNHSNTTWRAPALLRLPKCITGMALRTAAASLVPPNVAISLSILNSRGRRCGRCPSSGDCRGCPLDAGQHTLQPSDCLAVRCQGEAPPVQLHPSLEGGEFPKTLTLADCLKAFCESETLDEENHWLCPMCRCHRGARKTLSLWRLPKTLMVYLKRFIFQEFSGSKLEAPVEFPLGGLNLSPFVRGPHGSREGSCTYDLHAFVCHFGDVNSGHYTAYTRHGVSGQWFHYDDEAPSLRTPTVGDRQHAYVLFYQLRNSHAAEKSHPLLSSLENVVGPLDPDSPPESATLGLRADTFQSILCHLEDCPPTPSAL